MHVCRLNIIYAHEERFVNHRYPGIIIYYNFSMPGNITDLDFQAMKCISGGNNVAAVMDHAYPARQAVVIFRY